MTATDVTQTVDPQRWADSAAIFKRALRRCRCPNGDCPCGRTQEKAS